MSRVVEIVCCSAEDCAAAVKAGAGRIELCSAIELGGLTPSYGLVQESARLVSAPLMLMLRPRPGGFSYSETEFQTMLADLEAVSGAVGESHAGFVFGILQADRTIDRQRCQELIAITGGRETVFHRAFDLVPNPFEALETLIDLGLTRILTSGLAPTAAEGADQIKRLLEKADGRIEVMPGGGVRSANASKILTTGCKSIHLAPRRQAANGAMEVDQDEVSAVAQLCK